MSDMMIICGHYTGRTFVPDGPLPDAEGVAELVITLSVDRPTVSIADAFGTATELRSAAEILAKSRADRDDWGDR
jgi:hypothetical protein